MPRKTSWLNQLTKSSWTPWLIVAVVVLGGGFFYAASWPPSVNQLELYDTRDSGSTTNLKCETNPVKLFTLGDPCGSLTFRSAAVQCVKGDLKIRLGNGQTCQTPVAWMTEALTRCPATCQTPSVRPSPIASCRPRPACLDAARPCKLPITPDMCPPASPSPSATPISGCYIVPTQCSKAPCPPSVTVCPSAFPSPVASGRGCVNPPKECLATEKLNERVCDPKPGMPWCLPD